MDPNYRLTESQIELQAKNIFPSCKELQSSFILGVYRGLYEEVSTKNEL